jgi:glycosyltransferase involved in cell wall biosynthesis
MSDPLPRSALSLVVVAYDAGREIGECLASARLASETIVVDSGSRDDTVEIARRFGARVIVQPWLGYGAQKNFAVGSASHDWVLCLDADERLSPELESAVRKAMDAPRHAAYAMARRNRFLGRWLAHGEGYPDWNVRLFDRRRARWSDDVVHEHVVVDGSIGRLHGDLLHASAESLDGYLAKQNRYTTLQAEAMHARGEHSSSVRLVLSPLARFLRFYVLRGGFLDGSAGLVHIAIGSFASFCKHAKLRALERAERAP